ncbi:hypothetical protein GCM10029992_24630 [Glycomyces albus]
MSLLQERTTDKAALPALLPPVRRALKHPALMHYNRLAALVVAVNLAVLWAALPGAVTAEFASLAALANFALAVLIRRQRLINLLFRLATAAPVTWPLRVRWTLAKVYHFGGLHVGEHWRARPGSAPSSPSPPSRARRPTYWRSPTHWWRCSSSSWRRRRRSCGRGTTTPSNSSTASAAGCRCCCCGP